MRFKWEYSENCYRIKPLPPYRGTPVMAFDAPQSVELDIAIQRLMEALDAVSALIEAKETRQ